MVLLPFYAMTTGAEIFSRWLWVDLSLRAEFLADDPCGPGCSGAGRRTALR